MKEKWIKSMRIPKQGVEVDLATLRKKQKALMRQIVERKVRSRAQQLYETRGQAEGQDLQDWFQAESEVLENKTIASLYRKIKKSDSEDRAPDANVELADVELAEQETATCP
jgi:DNA-binding SARP family transcriptional activator